MIIRMSEYNKYGTKIVWLEKYNRSKTGRLDNIDSAVLISSASKAQLNLCCRNVQFYCGFNFPPYLNIDNKGDKPENRAERLEQ